MSDTQPDAVDVGLGAFIESVTPQPDADREARYLDTLNAEWWTGSGDYALRAIRAVMAVADAEQATLHGYYEAHISRVVAEHNLVLGLQKDATRRWRARAEKAEAALADPAAPEEKS